MTQHSSAFNAFANLAHHHHHHSSYIVDNVVSSGPYHSNTSQYPSIMNATPANWSVPSTNVPPTAALPNRLPIPLQTHAYPTSNGSSPDPQKPYGAYSSIYPLPISNSRSLNFQNSYDRHSVTSRRRSENDIVYPLGSSHGPTPQSGPASTLSTHALLERQANQWEGSQRNLHSSSNSMGSMNWIPPAPEDQYFNLNSNWGDTSPPPQSPDMRLYMPSPGYTFPNEAPTHQQSQASIYDSRRQVSPTSTSSTASPPASRRGSVDQTPTGGKICSHCHATSTPLWRREPNTLKPLCNACGLYLQQRNKHRPQELIDADAAEDLSESEGDGSGPECSHCHTHHTSVWRRSKTGAQLCNACGVYSRLRGRDRPLSLKRNRIKPRTKHNIPPRVE